MHSPRCYNGLTQDRPPHKPVQHMVPARQEPGSLTEQLWRMGPQFGGTYAGRTGQSRDGPETRQYQVIRVMQCFEKTLLFSLRAIGGGEPSE